MAEDNRGIKIGLAVAILLTIAQVLGGIGTAAASGQPIELWPNPWFLSAGVTLLAAVALLALLGRSSAKQTNAISRPQSSQYNGATGPAGELSSVVIPASAGPTVPVVTFNTQGRRNAHESTKYRPRALRFVLPVEANAMTIRESDLPVEVPCGGGKLIVKRFTESGVVFEEDGTEGVEVRAEVYYEGRGPSSSEVEAWAQAVLKALSEHSSLTEAELVKESGLRLDRLEEAVRRLEARGTVQRSGQTFSLGQASERDIAQPITPVLEKRHEASTVWSIRHGWGRHPRVIVLDAQGHEVITDIRHPDDDTVEIGFSLPHSGTSRRIGNSEIEVILDPD